MKRESWLHCLIAAFALIATSFAIFRQVTVVEWEPLPPAPPSAPYPATVADARGNATPSRSYHRIVLCTGAALIQQMLSVEKIAAIDRGTAQNPAASWAFLDTPRVPSVTDVDAILALRPDLVIAHLISDAEHNAATRLMAEGCQVFDPGEVTDIPSLVKCCHDLGELLQVRPQANLVVESVERRARILALHASAPPVPVRLSSLPQGAAATARLQAALELAGMSLADTGQPATLSRPVLLAVDALEDPLGSDLLDVATSLRMELTGPGGNP